MKLWKDAGESSTLTRAVCLTARGGAAPAARVRLVPLAQPSEEACGVLLVPDGVDPLPVLDGARVEPGLHVLSHGQCLDFGARYWVSLDLTPREAPYAPDVHGQDVFCARSKLRLAPGDPVVACPRCQLVYGARAWEAAPTCHACRFDTRTAPWTPPTPSSTPDLDALLRLARP